MGSGNKLDQVLAFLRDMGRDLPSLLDRQSREIAELRRAVEEGNKRADLLVDRLIQMSMVNQGAFREALSLQKSGTLSPTSLGTGSSPDDWGRTEQARDDEWPPEDYIAMNLP